jgi:tetratricopeptide (TPR) repeat protein
MFKNLSIKLKIIIFILLSLIGLFIIVETAVENNEKQKLLKTQFDSQISVAEKNKEKQEEEKRRQEEEKIKLEEQNKLKAAREEKYNKAFELYSKENKYTEAIKLSDEIIVEDEAFYKAYCLKGIALCYLGAARGDGGRYEEGIAHINKSLEIKPDYGYAVFNLAEAYGLYGHYDKAIEAYNRAISIEPKYVWNYYGLSRIYSRKKDAANSLKYLKQAMEIDASVKNSIAADIDFNNMKNNQEFNKLIGK